VNVLGIWDGHDSGAALIMDGRLVAAVNEERLTRRKLEVCFPARSIALCCQLGGIRPGDVQVVGASTSDVAKTLSRIAPASKERYYRFRRRLVDPGPFAALTRTAKYWITEWPPNRMTRSLSLRALRGALLPAGVTTRDVRLYDHHACHAVAAAAACGFDACGVITVDGVGDGLSATVSTWESRRLTRLASTPARHSPGIFFEHVTNLLNMRELEDEGKVMALSDYASPVPDEANPLLPLLRVEGLRFELRVPGHRLKPVLRRLQYRYANEQFAAMAQRTLEQACVSLARNVVRHTGHGRLALAGGVASNVKATRLIRLLPEVDELFVLPHMGDGGLALGAALHANRQGEEMDTVALAGHDLALGPSYSDGTIARALENHGLSAPPAHDLARQTAALLAGERVVLWFQGRMEYGPRALGHRSVLARPDRPHLRDRLNLVLKRRVWYQPVCPSILERDAHRLLAELDGAPNRHMTSAYMVRPDARAHLAGVISVDGTCRPQIVEESQAGPYADLLRAMRAHTGTGAVLNTSFNVHGQPLVCTPDEAIGMFRESGADALAIGPFLVYGPGVSPPAASWHDHASIR
jgi:carbamoyltransferase